MESFSSVLRALDTLRELNESGKRKLPDGALLDFVPPRWQKHVYDEEGNINRHYYEIAALMELRNHIQSGDIWVVGSHQHKDFGASGIKGGVDGTAKSNSASYFSFRQRLS